MVFQENCRYRPSRGGVSMARRLASVRQLLCWWGVVLGLLERIVAFHFGKSALQSQRQRFGDIVCHDR